VSKDKLKKNGIICQIWGGQALPGSDEKSTPRIVALTEKDTGCARLRRTAGICESVLMADTASKACYQWRRTQS
jgi:hypothetical protein